MSDPRPFDMPPLPPNASRAQIDAAFDARGGWLINRLMEQLNLTEVQAAGIVGNLGGESGLAAVQEINPIAGKGGFGWEQATGPRRRQFEQYAADRGMKVTDDEANYGFLILELLGSEANALAKLRKTTTVEQAVYSFEVLFERPSDPQAGLNPRIRYANRAIAAARASRLPPIERSPLTTTTIAEVIMELQGILKATGYYTGNVDGIFGPMSYAAVQTYQAKRGAQA